MDGNATETLSNPTETSPVETPTEETPEATAPEQGSTGPTAEDYKKMGFKYKKMYEDLKASVQQPAPQAVTEGAGISDDQTEEAWKQLESLIDRKLQPVVSGLQVQDEQTATHEIMSMPYSQALEPEIKAEFAKLPDSMKFGDRLLAARNAAIASNLAVITKVNKETGRTEAYTNQQVKAGANSSLGETPGQAGAEQPESWLEKSRAGKLTKQEYKEHRAEIEAEERQALGLK